MQYCKSRFGYRVTYPVSVFFLYIIQVPKCNNRKREIPRGEKMMKGMKLVPEEREKEIHIYDGASINIKKKKKKKAKDFLFYFFQSSSVSGADRQKERQQQQQGPYGFHHFPNRYFS